VSLRILYVSHYALPHLGGIEVVVDALARELATRGHRVVHVASTAHGGAVGREPSGYEVVRVPALNGLESRLGVPWPMFAPSLLPRLRREVAAADVVHAHGMLYMSSALALALAARAGTRRVLTEHVGHVAYAQPALDRIQALAIGSLGRASVRRAQAVVVLNEKVRSEMAGLGARGPVVTIANGVDTAAYRPPEPGEREALRAALGWDERPRVLFVGRLVAKKGIDLAIGAAQRAAGAFELVVAGPGRAPEVLPASVRVLGAQPPARVAELYRAADALVLPSHGEGFPIVVQEAMASGTPVVVLDDPSYEPYLEGAGAGARRVPAEPGAIAGALRELLADPAAGAAALEYARLAFSWAEAADAHEALYRSL